jgi:hypothetical protein
MNAWKTRFAHGLRNLWCSQSFAQDSDEWSLEPLENPFPCNTVQLTSTSIMFLKPLKISCNGKQFLNPLPGSTYFASYACDHTSGVILLDEGALRRYPNNLLQIIRKDCPP